MLRAWNSPVLRYTKDIDLLGKINNSASYILAVFQEILEQKIEPDGLDFDIGSLRSEAITEEEDYVGTRLLFNALLGKARISMQIDIGFGDVIFPKPEILEIPTIISPTYPKLFCYSRESAIAEKFQTMIKKGITNSRMKDFYDIWLLSRQFDFQGKKLGEAIRRTFTNRDLSIPKNPTPFSVEFSRQKQIQWAPFRRKLKQPHVPEEFSAIISEIELFLQPIASAIQSNTLFSGIWKAPGPWKVPKNQSGSGRLAPASKDFPKKSREGSPSKNG